MDRITKFLGAGLLFVLLAFLSKFQDEIFTVFWFVVGSFLLFIVGCHLFAYLVNLYIKIGYKD
jgi:hypothetical protein